MPTSSSKSSSSPIMAVLLYREVLTFVDQFMALHFTTIGAPLAAMRI
jgi:hypothetical protein